MADLSIEEANKIRMSMGMAPLPVPGAAAPSGPSMRPKWDDNSDDEPASTVETRQAAAHDNWQKLQDEQAAAKKKADRLAAIKKEREKAGRFAKLEGKGLADVEDEDDLTWLKGSRKRAKKIAKADKMQLELEERERQAREALQYTEADLAGVKVGHEVDHFDDGEDQVLVLKDTTVDAEDDDELEAVALKEKEQLKEKLDSKKRKRAYDPNDDAQTSILAQYDEEIDGKKRKAFTLDGQGRTVEDVEAEAAGIAKPKRVAISLDILNEDAPPANDYVDISEVKIKKSKKKKKPKSSKRQHVEDEDDMFAAADEPVDEMEVDDGPAIATKPKKKILEDQSFIDDDDLQAQLAKQRREALKKRKKMRVEDLARQLREEDASAPQTPDVMDSTELVEATPEDDGGLVIDETTEFVHNLEVDEEEQEQERRRRQRQITSHGSNGLETSAYGDFDDEGDVHMGYAEAAEAEERNDSRARSLGATTTGLEEEKTLDKGMGQTLALLKQRGMWTASEGEDKNSLYRDRQKFLADKMHAEESAERLRKEQRERERNSARWNTMTPREREEWSRKNNVNADHMESRKLADIFNKEYKPTFDLNYVDEHGRHLNQKEAFKMLSHQFHGKGSGNTKTKKHLDKIAGEKRKMAESSLDTTSGGLNNARDHAAKKNRASGIRMQ